MTSAVYDKGAALVQDKQTGRKLQRVGEVQLDGSRGGGGLWFANDEMVRRRQYA